MSARAETTGMFAIQNSASVPENGMRMFWHRFAWVAYHNQKVISKIRTAKLENDMMKNHSRFVFIQS